MLMGEYKASLDSKGRLNFPSKLREALGETFIVTKGLDNCLFVYSKNEWKVLEEKIRALPMGKGRNLQRFFFAGACEAQADKQGRIILPSNLREYANLNKDMTIIGVSNRAEIWASDAYKDNEMGLTAESIADAIDDIDF